MRAGTSRAGDISYLSSNEAGNPFPVEKARAYCKNVRGFVRTREVELIANIFNLIYYLYIIHNCQTYLKP